MSLIIFWKMSVKINLIDSIFQGNGLHRILHSISHKNNENWKTLKTVLLTNS